MYTVCVVPGSVFSESVYTDNFYMNTYTALLLTATTVYISAHTRKAFFLTAQSQVEFEPYSLCVRVYIAKHSVDTRSRVSTIKGI